MNKERFWTWFWDMAAKQIRHCENNCPYEKECLGQPKMCDEFLREKYIEYEKEK